MSRKARWARPSTCRPPGRSTIDKPTARAVGAGQLQRSGASDVTPRLSGLVTASTLATAGSACWSRSPMKSASCSRKAPTSRAGPMAAFNGGFNAASTLHGLYDRPDQRQHHPATALYHPRIPVWSATTSIQKRLGAAGVAAVPADRPHADLDRRPLLAPRRHPRGGPVPGDRLQSLGHAASRRRSSARRSSMATATSSSGTFDNVDLRTQSRYDELETDFQQSPRRSTRSSATS